jgi:signal transduction histidine kinase
VSESAVNSAARQAFIDGLFFRVVACAFLEVVIFATAISSRLPLKSFAPPMAVVAADAALDVLYWFVGKWRNFPVRDFYVHWIIDLLGISFTIYWLGGLDVPYGPFIYSMIVITSATFASRTGSYLIAGGAGLCLIGLGFGVRLGILPAPASVWSHHFSFGGEIAVLVGAIIFFFMNAYLAGTLSDQLKAAKAEIEGHNKLLERRVRERTRELEARTLQLQERTDELEELVHIVTHDLQNVAVASAETARKLVEIDGAQLSERGTRNADRLIRDCRRMTTMLRNLLEVVSQTEVADRRDVIDVNAVVREAVGRAHAAIDSKNIEVVIGKLPALQAEEQKIHHVFDNLVTNACKYVGDKDHPRIEISGEVENGSVEYVVRDNGIGIASNQMGRIFQLYHRAPEQTVAGVIQQGHGIGLAVVKRIVQRYGGRIWVESVEGQGASFHLSFPREDRVTS